MNRAEGPMLFTEPEAVAEAILSKVGRRIVLALPLGLGKAIHIANALYARAAADASIELRIITALSLSRPQPGSDLERRFQEPIIERAFGNCPELAYAEPLRNGDLPANIQVHEFFLQAGQWLDAPLAQQGYISANYTHAIPLILEGGVNVVAQLVAKRGEGAGACYNLSGNTDVTHELLAARRVGKANFLLVGQVHGELPYMAGDAEIGPGELDFALEGVEFTLPAPPRRPIADADHAMGVHIASLIPDGGTLQLGIGSLGHAVVQGLILRHKHPSAFRELAEQLAPGRDHAGRCFEPFQRGLYAASEMFADALLELFHAGILKREVDGGVLDAAFFLGPRDFYRALREMPERQRQKLRMRSVAFINELYGEDEAARRAQRVNARFVNNAMIVTALGAIVSDGLEDGRVVSGVGGQYNFVAQAFALQGARSVVALPATRTSKGKTSSNIKWSYGHVTIPRHLRDIVVTEYGVADLRGRSDAETIVQMLAITDSRFQEQLLDAAKRARKLPKRATIPAGGQNNDWRRVRGVLADARRAGRISDFPFGKDYSEAEKRLFPALGAIRDAAHSKLALARLALSGLSSARDLQSQAMLERLKLASPGTFSERVSAALVRGGISRSAEP